MYFYAHDCICFLQLEFFKNCDKNSTASKGILQEHFAITYVPKNILTQVLTYLFKLQIISTVGTIALFVHSMAIWVWSFQMGGIKLERFLPKNQHTQRNLLNFENWVSGEVSKRCKITKPLDFQSQFSISKIIRIFPNFFSQKNINLGAHFLLSKFFDNINY